MNIWMNNKDREFIPKSGLELKGYDPSAYKVDKFVVSGSIKALLNGLNEAAYEHEATKLVGKPINYKGEQVGVITSVDLDTDTWYGEIVNKED